jgi:hypothetical protein
VTSIEVADGGTYIPAAASNLDCAVPASTSIS